MIHRSLRSVSPGLVQRCVSVLACSSAMSCSAGDAGPDGPSAGMTQADSGASSQPVDDAGNTTATLDATSGTPRPADASSDSASPADASGGPLRPTDAASETTAPADASGGTARPTDASGDTTARADASGGPPRPSDAASGDSSQPAITVWLAGDSTVENYVSGNAEGANGSDLEGWGQELGQFFNGKVTVQNQAIGGRSVADFIFSVVRDEAGAFECIDDAGDPDYQLDSQGRRIDPSQWAAIKAGIKPGDFLLIQFGTNDETHTCPRFVTLPDFEADLGLMADTVRAKGATAIFVTPMGHRTFNSDGTVNNTLLPYANAMKAEAALEGLEVADLNLASVAYYASVGNAFLAASIFDGGTTHFIHAGAVEMASLVAGEIRKDNGPLASYLK